MGKDRYYVEAFGIGCTDKEEKIYSVLKKNMGTKKYEPKYAGLVWRLHTVSSIPEIKSWALDENLDEKIYPIHALCFEFNRSSPSCRRPWLASQKMQRMKPLALAKAFIDKRDQGIWNKYKAKDLLSGKSPRSNCLC